MLSVVRLVCLFIGHEQNPLLPRCPWGTIALIKAGAELLFASLGPSDPFLTLLILRVELKLPKKALAQADQEFCAKNTLCECIYPPFHLTVRVALPSPRLYTQNPSLRLWVFFLYFGHFSTSSAVLQASPEPSLLPSISLAVMIIAAFSSDVFLLFLMYPNDFPGASGLHHLLARSLHFASKTTACFKNLTTSFPCKPFTTFFGLVLASEALYCAAQWFEGPLGYGEGMQDGNGEVRD